LEVLNSLLLGRSILIISCGTYVIAVYESLIRSIKKFCTGKNYAENSCNVI
jgi:hypothetical protein